MADGEQAEETPSAGDLLRTPLIAETREDKLPLLLGDCRMRREREGLALVFS